MSPGGRTACPDAGGPRVTTTRGPQKSLATTTLDTPKVPK